MAEPTPGPWSANRYVGREENWFVRGPNQERVCGQGAGCVTEANARLIAAAPELLEALGWFVDDERFVVSVGGNPAVVEEMIEHASDIYRKARGGAS